MVKLRLTRMGRHKRAFYRIVAVDSRIKTAGGYIELLGHVDPITEETKLFDDAILKWLSQGAQPSDTVKNILKEKGIWAKFISTKTAKPKATAKKPAKKPTAKPVAKPAAKPKATAKKTTTKK